jgi:hypothetical protein
MSVKWLACAGRTVFKKEVVTVDAGKSLYVFGQLFWGFVTFAIAALVIHHFNKKWKAKARQQGQGQQAMQHQQQWQAWQRPQAAPAPQQKPELVGCNWKAERPFVHLVYDGCAVDREVKTLKLQFIHWDELQSQAGTPGVMRKLRTWGYI